ncbi:MAG: CAAX prenyl protease-related protein [Chthoniobacterales bacterium]
MWISLLLSIEIPERKSAMQKRDVSPQTAYLLPFGLFMGGLLLLSLVQGLGSKFAYPFLQHPEFWVYPLQTVVCGLAVVFLWRNYSFRFNSGILLGVLAGLVSLGIWISPQVIFGKAARVEGFNPDLLQPGSFYYWCEVGLRFLRLALVVPFLEEIFWRGFLMRYFIKPKFTDVPFGTYQTFSFLAVAVLFALEHGMVDWIPAVLTGLLYNGLAVRTKSMGSCVIAHAVTNLGLGFYIMATKQWGFW